VSAPPCGRNDVVVVVQSHQRLMGRRRWTCTTGNPVHTDGPSDLVGGCGGVSACHGRPLLRVRAYVGLRFAFVITPRYRRVRRALHLSADSNFYYCY